MRLVLLSVVTILPNLGLTLWCYRCQNGYATSEVCSDQLPSGGLIECQGTNAQCYESVQWFQNGALQLAIRDCWTPPDNTTVGGFCDNYNNTVGVLRYCKNCTQDGCNTDKIYSPVRSLNC